MAADYWSSHSSAGLVSRHHILNAHWEDRARGLTEGHCQQIKAYFVNLIWELCRTCKLRYRVAATAAVYFQRFYVRNSFGVGCRDPRLVYVGCVYISSKTEESLLAAKHLVVYVRRLHPGWPYEIKHILDSEMVIIQELDFQLVVYHAYRPLAQYAQDAGLPHSLVQYAWAALNDLHRGAAHLMYPPHVLALGCLVYAWGIQASRQQPGGGTSSSAAAAPVAVNQPPQECIDWVLQLNIDMCLVLEVVQELGSLYTQQANLLSGDEVKRLLDVAHIPLATSGLPPALAP